MADTPPVSANTISDAAELIGDRVRRTPVMDIEVPGAGTITLKLELFQHTGSFKPRGAFTTVLRRIQTGERPTGLVAASGGNHGLAVAHVGASLGIPARIFVPTTAPAVKVARLHGLGADVTQIGTSYAQAYLASRRAAEDPGALAVHAYDGPDTLAGTGTVAAELTGQAQVDTVLVAVGGGGLLGGIASWCAALPAPVRVIAVEPTGCPTLHTALAAGAPVDIEPAGLAADSLGATRIGEDGWRAARAAGVRSVLVADDQIRAARDWLWRQTRIVAEPGGVTALAAVLCGGYRPEPGERVAVIVCGANADPGDLPQA